MDVTELEDSLAKRSKNCCWVFLMFILTSTPGIFNSMHLNAYVFLSGYPKIWCEVAALKSSNWSNEEIKKVSAINPTDHENCYMYDWNYENFSEIGYSEALDYINNNTKPKKIKCTKYVYEEERRSLASEWDLVCDRRAMLPVTQLIIAMGKFTGALIIGIFADRFGRKPSYIFCSFLYIISGSLAGFAPYYWLFLVMRFLIGVAGGGLYQTGYTILTELTVKAIRTVLAITYNMTYPLGLFILPVLAFYSKNWRYLQYSISIPAVLLLVNCWLIPESPRWLISQGRVEEAKKIIYGKKKYEELRKSGSPELAPQGTREEDSQPWYKKLFSVGLKLWRLFANGELRKRILICYFEWFVAALSYFTIILNVHNFNANEFIYIPLNGAAEAAGYMLPVIMLILMGRKLSALILYLIAGAALLAILVITDSLGIMIEALVGRLCMSAVYAVIILYTSELFPTSNRNTAIGSSLTVSQLGVMLAPFVVGLLGRIAWYIPSTICGVICIVGALLVLLLPETRNRPLKDSLKDIEALDEKEKVACANCCRFK